VGRLIYLVAEDERLLYPAGEQTLRITEVLSDPAIELVVRTQALYEHLLSSGIPDLHSHARVFEPAFPAAGREGVSGGSDRRRLVCFASPDIPGDLYHRAVDTIDTALRTDVVDPAGWSIALVGDGLGPVSFAHGVTPELIEPPYWQARDAIARDADVGLVLGSGPSPRDWVLRLAAHGRVVVTNRFDDRDSSAGYGASIVHADSDVNALIGALRTAVALAADEGHDVDTSGFERDWRAAFGQVLDQVDAP
jgi:hypothetical protein